MDVFHRMTKEIILIKGQMFGRVLLTLCILTSVCTFSILVSFHFLTLELPRSGC